jgi:acyl-CoA thioester hydrolase
MRMDMPYLTPLTPDQQRSAGLTLPQPLAIADRVRFSELDPLNHVNNVAYLEWFERMRIRYSLAWEVSPFRGRPDAPRIVIRSGEIRYHAEVLSDADYIATCGCVGFRTTSYELHQEIWSGGTLRATFDCVLVLLEQTGSGRMPIPQALRDRFVQIDGAASQI